MKKVTIVSTNTDQVFDIETNAETWGELSRHERIGGANGMRAMIGETKHTLESPDAILPQTDFTLYLSPSKVKSGFSREDREDIDEIIEFLEDNGAGRNLTRFMTRLRDGVARPQTSSNDETPVLRSTLTPEVSRSRQLLEDAKRAMR